VYAATARSMVKLAKKKPDKKPAKKSARPARKGA
jgi:hypothetical protein